MIRIFALSIFCINSIFAAVFTFKGEAFREDGSIAYLEKHTKEMNGKLVQKIETLYLDPKTKEVFASLKSDFTKNQFIPEIVFEDKRFNLRVDSLISGEKVTLIKKSRKRGQKREEKKSFKIEDKMMLGQGYNNFIVTLLGTLKPGQIIPIKFLVSKSMDTFNFEVLYKGEVEAGKVGFHLEIESWFLKAFAPTLDIIYETKSGRILEFKGMTNIPDKDNKSQNLTIKYSY